MISARCYSSQSHNNHAPEDDDNNSAITAAVIATDNKGPCLYSVSWWFTAECDALKKETMIGVMMEVGKWQKVWVLFYGVCKGQAVSHWFGHINIVFLVSGSILIGYIPVIPVWSREIPNLSVHYLYSSHHRSLPTSFVFLTLPEAM